MKKNHVCRVKSISEFYKVRNLAGPDHPLISLVDYSLSRHSKDMNSISWMPDFYCIALKRGLDARIIYGQQEYDFDKGAMFFIAPGQVFKVEVNTDAPGKSGWMLLVHPDLFWNLPLAQSIKKYKYFGYSVREALFLLENEESILNGIVQTIRQEYLSVIDKFSPKIIASQIEVLLNYAERFYNRQFLTREVSNHLVLEKLEALLNEYFEQPILQNGLPTVHHLAEQLNLSPDYLTTLLKVTTGLSTQQHIHEMLIKKAKEKLTGTQLSVTEIAYELGFEHSQSFNKLFKAKTSLTPSAFRQANC